jgi:DNA-binding NarL/FixJ family response regulator
MLRPKPVKSLNRFQVQLSDHQLAVFRRLGGSQWLRQQLATVEARAHNVHELLAAGKSHSVIAQELGISTKTIQVVKKQNWFPE